MPLASFNILASVSRASMDIEVYVSFCFSAFVLFCFSAFIPKSGVVGSYGSSVCNSLIKIYTIMDYP